MSMADELADTHAAESADIGAGSDAVIGRDTPAERTTPDKPVSIRDGLNAAIKEVGEKAARDRDQQTGKFTRKSSEAPLEAASTEIPAPKENVATASTVSGPPPIWAKVWDSLTPEAQAIAVKRESDSAKGIDEYKGKAAQLQEITKAFEPVRHLLQQGGIQNEAQAVKRLLDWETAIRSNPAQGIASLARQYGVDLSQLAQGNSQAPQGQEIPEHLRPVLDQFGQMSQTVASLQSEIQNSRQEKIASELSTFAKDKPHFEKVRVRMGQMMAAGIVPATDLNAAYEQAVWADPDLRTELLKELDEKRKAEFTQAQSNAGTRARIAAVSPAPRARQGAPLANGHDKGAKGVKGSILSAIKQLEEDQRA